MKRTIALLLVAALLILSGCAPKTEAEPTATPTASGNAVELGELTFMSEMFLVPDGLEYRAEMAVSGDNLYFASSDKLYRMAKNDMLAVEMSEYAPLDGYTLLTVGTAHGGGLLALESGVGKLLVSFVDESGLVTSTLDITQAMERYKESDVRKIFAGADGNIYITLAGEVVIANPDGTGTSVIHDANIELLDAAMSVDGAAYVCAKVGNSTAYSVIALNSDGTLGTIICEIPYDPIYATLVPKLVSGSGKLKLLYSDYNNLYSISPAGGEVEKLFAWNDMAMTGGANGGMWCLSEGSIVARYATTSTGDNLHLIEQRLEPPRIALRLATFETYDFVLPTLVAEFNQNNTEYKIIIDNYSRYDEDGGAGAGLLRLNTEIQSGNVPDLINFAFISPDAYESSGLLVDLYPLIDADPTLERSGLFDSYYRNFDRNGKLYLAPQSSGIYGLVGKTEVVGSEHGWTLDEMLAIQAQYAPNAPALGGMTRGNATFYYVNSVYREFIDTTTGKCSFDSDDFVRIIELLATLGDTATASFKGVLSGEQIVFPLSLSEVYMLQTLDELFGETEYTVKGLPMPAGSEDKNGLVSTYQLVPTLGITTSCANVDGAWSFIRWMFGGKTSIMAFVPTGKAAMELKFKDYYSQYQETVVNEDGTEEVVSRMKGFNIEYGISDNSSIYLEEIDLFAPTDEQAERFYELADSCDIAVSAGTGSSLSSNRVVDIILEELQPFYAGSKSALDTSAIIQSRVQIYVDERR